MAPLPCPKRQRTTAFGDAGSGRFQDLTLGWQLDGGGRIISVGVGFSPPNLSYTPIHGSGHLWERRVGRVVRDKQSQGPATRCSSADTGRSGALQTTVPRRLLLVQCEFSDETRGNDCIDDDGRRIVSCPITTGSEC